MLNLMDYAGAIRDYLGLRPDCGEKEAEVEDGVHELWELAAEEVRLYCAFEVRAFGQEKA